MHMHLQWNMPAGSATEQPPLGGLVIHADRALLAQVAAVNQRMGRETLVLLDSMREGMLPAERVDELGKELIALGHRLRHRAGELAQPAVEGAILSA
jgi:hypothetical protein